jgi:polyhydroxyalkanoate synthesis regulator protein
MAKPHDPIPIGQYDRRLYHPGMGCYLTLGDLAAMVEDEEDFVVRDGKTGDDVTRSVLMRVIRAQVNHG